MSKQIKRKIYTGRYLAAARHLIRELTQIYKYDSGLPVEQRFYNNQDISNKAIASIERAQDLCVAYIFKDGSVDPPISPE